METTEGGIAIEEEATGEVVDILETEVTIGIARARKPAYSRQSCRDPRQLTVIRSNVFVVQAPTRQRTHMCGGIWIYTGIRVDRYMCT